jgi:hypothetical protein
MVEAAACPMAKPPRQVPPECLGKGTYALVVTSKPIPQDHGSNLPNLVRLHFVAFPLHVDELLNAWLHEAMVAASYTLLKAQAFRHPQIVAKWRPT